METKKVKFSWDKLKNDYPEVTYQDVQNQLVLWMASNSKRLFLQFGENRMTDLNKAMAKVITILFLNDGSEGITFVIEPTKLYENVILESDFIIKGVWDIYEANLDGRTIQSEIINCYIVGKNE